MNRSDINKLKNNLFKCFAIVCTITGVVVLFILLYSILTKGFSRLNWDFFTSLPSRKPAKAGIFTALIGMIWVVALTVIISFPIGIGAGIYMEEYGKKNRLSRIIEVNISNLAGVPSIIYGILGLQIFARFLKLENSILTGSFTLSLLILPIIIVQTREAIKSVPGSLRNASYGLGATKWQTIIRVVLPASFGSILTGLILAISRAVGETAPLIVIGALVYVPFVPKSPMDQFTVLPIQIFNWTSRPQPAFAVNAAAGIIALLLFVFLLNGIAVILRGRFNKKTRY